MFYKASTKQKFWCRANNFQHVYSRYCKIFHQLKERI